MKSKRADRLASLEAELDAILAYAAQLEERYRPQLDQLHPEQGKSGLNLLHYLALRRRDARALQEELATHGLSSLGRLEASVLSSILAVHQAVRALQGDVGRRSIGPVTNKQGRKLLKKHTRALLGRKTKGSWARIMVTLPVEAEADPPLVQEFLEAGMNCARINCAQGGPEEWKRIIEHVHRARNATGRACKVFMDLSGPKIRTGPLLPGPPCLTLRPKRDPRGQVLEPKRLTLVPEPEDGLGAHTWTRALRPEPPSPPRVPLTRELFSRLEAGDRLTVRDARGQPGTIEVESVAESEAAALCHVTLFLESGLPVSLDTGTEAPPPVGAIGTLPPLDNPMRLRVGDTLVIHKDPRPGEGGRTEDGVIHPAHVSCTLPEVLDHVAIGESVVLDDGKARGVIAAIREGEIDVSITHAGPNGAKIRGHKGINLPESRLRILGLTPQDKEDLRFIAEHADGVNVSFVNHPDDIEDLCDELDALGCKDLGLIVKIETRKGFQNLPGILLAAMERPTVGVMIARGDLAVEAGWTHLAHIQEEILWICEAAHVPVVWATEVLDRLAKKGIPTRSEISDVVMAERAECVMLNKGPYMVEAIRTLDEVLRSIQGYQSKKTSLLPALAVEEPDPEEVGRAVGLRQKRWEER